MKIQFTKTEKLCITSFVLILFFLCFFLQEVLPQIKLIDSKLSNFFTAIAAIGAVVTLIYIQRQIKMQEDQIKLSVLPDIVPEILIFSVKDNQNMNFPGKSPEIPYVTIVDEKHLKIVNKGIGNAKKITCKWMYDMNELTNYIGGIYGIYRKNENANTLGYLKTDESFQFPFSPIYLQCLGTDLNMDVNKWIKSISTLEKFSKPQIKLEIHYFDVLGTPYTKTFEAKFLKVFQENIEIQFDEI